VGGGGGGGGCRLLVQGTCRAITGRREVRLRYKEIGKWGDWVEKDFFGHLVSRTGVRQCRKPFEECGLRRETERNVHGHFLEVVGKVQDKLLAEEGVAVAPDCCRPSCVTVHSEG